VHNENESQTKPVSPNRPRANVACDGPERIRPETQNKKTWAARRHLPRGDIHKLFLIYNLQKTEGKVKAKQIL
jgi:hypothetical protein